MRNQNVARDLRTVNHF